MGLQSWAAENWFTLLQSAGIIAGFLLAANSLRLHSRVSALTLLHTRISSHREIWQSVIQNPELTRILDSTASGAPTPIERLMIGQLVFHLDATLAADRAGVLKAPERLDADAREFFSLPIPSKVWEELRHLQDEELVEYIEGRRETGRHPQKKWILG